MSRVIFFCFSIGASQAAVDPKLQALLIAASEHVDIRGTSASPFQLEADFTAQFNVPINGHFTWKWAAKDLWSQEITAEDFHQLNIRNGDVLYISRNGPFTPLRITDLLSLVNVLSFEPDYWEAKKMKKQRRGELEIECIELHPRSGRQGDTRSICINPIKNEVIADESKHGQDQRREEFADYRSFGEHSYPSQLKLLVNGSTAVKIAVSSLREANFNVAVFTPPAGALARRQCENMRPPEPISTPDPAYPRSAAQNRLGGPSILEVTVFPDGSVDNVQLLGSAGHEMDEVSQQIVKTWKFKPAMCGSEAVAYDLRIEMNFRPR